LKRRLLAAGRGFAREQRQRVGEVAAGEIEDRKEVCWQRPAVVEEIVDRIGNVLLVLIERDARAECGSEVQNHIG